MEKKGEVVEDENNGPPPGWQLTPQLQPLQTSTPPSGTQQALLAGESSLFYSDSKYQYLCFQLRCPLFGCFLVSLKGLQFH